MYLQALQLGLFMNHHTMNSTWWIWHNSESCQWLESGITTIINILTFFGVLLITWYAFPNLVNRNCWNQVWNHINWESRNQPQDSYRFWITLMKVLNGRPSIRNFHTDMLCATCFNCIPEVSDTRNSAN